MVDNDGDTVKVVRDTWNKTCLRKKEVALFMLIYRVGRLRWGTIAEIEITFFFHSPMQNSIFGVWL